MLQTFAEEEDLEALCIFLDFEKAFDRCSWDYLRDAKELSAAVHVRSL